MHLFIQKTKLSFLENTKELYLRFKEVVYFAVLAFIIGLIVGAIATIFGKGLFFFADLRTSYPWLIFTLPLSGMLIVWVYLCYGKKVLGGMSLVFQAGDDEGKTILFRLVPLSIFGTWLTHFSGGSAGREGVAVQIGATVAMAFERFAILPKHRRILLLTGIAAGFGGLFGTPVAGTLFALEVLVVGKVYYEALVPALVGGFTASFTSGFLGLEHIKVALTEIPFLLPKYIVFVVIAGFAFGFVGRSFSWLVLHTRLYFANLIPNPLHRIALIGFILSFGLYFFEQGRYSGLSDEVFIAPFTGETFYWYDWFLKFLFTVLTLSAGYQGGELTPLFVIGSGLGATLALLLGLPVPFLAALGAIAVFSSATHTLFTPIFIGVEIFGSEGIIYFFAVCVASFVMSGRESIYQNQKDLRY